MKVTVYLNGVYISVKKTQGFDKDNRPVESNYIALESNEEVGNIKCNQGVFEEIQKEKKYTELMFQGVIDTWNKELVICGYKPREKQSE